MSTKDVCAPAGGEVPDADGAVCGTADEGVFACGECPDAAFVAYEGEEELACEGRVDVDGVVV